MEFLDIWICHVLFSDKMVNTKKNLKMLKQDISILSISKKHSHYENIGFDLQKQGLVTKHFFLRTSI